MSAGKQIRDVSGCFSSTSKQKMCRINSIFFLLSLVFFFFSLNLPWLHLCIIVFLLFFLRAALRGNGCISLILRWRFCGAATSGRAGEGFSFLLCHFVDDTVCFFVFPSYLNTQWGRSLGIFSSIAQVTHFAPPDTLTGIFFLLLHCMYTEILCVRLERSLLAMQMQILVFLWLCKKKKKIYMHVILYKNKSIENYN